MKDYDDDFDMFEDDDLSEHRKDYDDESYDFDDDFDERGGKSFNYDDDDYSFDDESDEESYE